MARGHPHGSPFRRREAEPSIEHRLHAFDRIRADRARGFSLVDEELERGLRALAVPVLDRSGQAVGAINLSTHASRNTRNEMREHFLPELNRVAAQVSSMTV